MNDLLIFSTVILPLFLIIFISTRLLTIVFHELGHAIPAMIFTDDKVTIFLGSYGDIEKSRNIKLNGRLDIYIVLNPRKWRGGMVYHHGHNLATFKRLIITSFGPLLSLILTSIALWVIFAFDFNGFLKLFFVIFFFSALFDLRNLYPSKTPILLNDGAYTYCDGFQILRLLKYSKQRDKMSLAYDFYNKGGYGEAIKLFETLSIDLVTNDILATIINAFNCNKNYQGAKEYYTKIINAPNANKEIPNSDILCNIGVVESNLGNDELALNYYNASLQLNSNNIYSLCNRGYTYNLFGNYNEALLDFEKAIEIDSIFSYAYANRGFAKIKLKMFEDALSDINEALNLNTKDAYAQRNLGVYHLEMNEYVKAYEQFKIAKELDHNLHLIDDYLKIAYDKLQEVK